MSADGNWKMTMTTPMGDQRFEMSVTTSGETFAGTVNGPDGQNPAEGRFVDNTLTWTADITKPMPMKLEFTAKVDGDSISGSVKLGMFGTAPLSGVRA